MPTLEYVVGISAPAYGMWGIDFFFFFVVGLWGGVMLTL